MTVNVANGDLASFDVYIEEDVDRLIDKLPVSRLTVYQTFTASVEIVIAECTPLPHRRCRQ